MRYLIHSDEKKDLLFILVKKQKAYLIMKPIIDVDSLNKELKNPKKISNRARCLKITEKVSFNIASEASYVYILSGRKLIKNAKNCPFWRVFENLKLAVKQSYQTGQF